MSATPKLLFHVSSLLYSVLVYRHTRAVASNRQTEALASVRILDLLIFLGSFRKLCFKSERINMKDVFFLILPHCQFLSGYGVAHPYECAMTYNRRSQNNVVIRQFDCTADSLIRRNETTGQPIFSVDFQNTYCHLDVSHARPGFTVNKLKKYISPIT